MALNNITLTFMQAVGWELPVILVAVRAAMEFIDNKPTGKIIGTIYTVVCPAKQYDKLIVRVNDETAIITQELLDQRNASGNPVMVTFEGFSAKVYQDYKTKEMKISATADRIIAVGEKEDKHAK